MSLRYFNTTGAYPDREIGEQHDPEIHLIPIILDEAAGNSAKCQEFGNDYETDYGRCIRDYIHVSELAYMRSCACSRKDDRWQDERFYKSVYRHRFLSYRNYSKIILYKMVSN